MPRPKGRPFTPGDKRINRAGRPPAAACLSDALRAWAGKSAGGGKVNAEALAEVLGRLALGGNVKAAALIADRMEGRPGQRLEVTDAAGRQLTSVEFIGCMSESAALMHTGDIPRAEAKSGGKPE